MGAANVNVEAAQAAVPVLLLVSATTDYKSCGYLATSDLGLSTVPSTLSVLIWAFVQYIEILNTSTNGASLYTLVISLNTAVSGSITASVIVCFVVVCFAVV